MDTQRALIEINNLIRSINQYEETFDALRSDSTPTSTRPALEMSLKVVGDHITGELVVARALAQAAGADELIDELRAKVTMAGHRWLTARRALVELRGVFAKHDLIESIVGPVGPRLAAASLHALVWGPAARLWSDGHHLQAVQTASVAIEGEMQAMLGKSDVAGADLASAFSVKSPDGRWPRLRIRGLDHGSLTWTSQHEGAGYLARSAFLLVRNGAAHPGVPAVDEVEALEQLALLSMLARLLERCDVVTGTEP